MAFHPAVCLRQASRNKLHTKSWHDSDFQLQSNKKHLLFMLHKTQSCLQLLVMKMVVDVVLVSPTRYCIVAEYALRNCITVVISEKIVREFKRTQVSFFLLKSHEVLCCVWQSTSQYFFDFSMLLGFHVQNLDFKKWIDSSYKIWIPSTKSKNKTVVK